ncbi:MAG: TIGR03790 family protein, partial [Patescibacteria group bacterium]|nr:TIGR03790 family protein [Patescibacteria group bacterium]
DVIMVSRLEAPTLEITRRLIDDAIRVEQQGLKGKVYLDARGISYDAAKDQPGSYGQYDASLRDLAARLKAHTQLEVVLDNEPALFQPGACPDAAVYCGWYSLAKYVDAFDWNPGAVGYHIASAEARTLRQPGETGWCSAMLEDGVAATLGPVFEPYLASFPLPDDFFPLLMTGKYTLVEAYYRSNPFNSWAMVLVGDPLYKPFAKNPPLAADALPERLLGRPDPGIAPAGGDHGDSGLPGAPAIPEMPAIPERTAPSGTPPIPEIPAIPQRTR